MKTTGGRPEGFARLRCLNPETPAAARSRSAVTPSRTRRAACPGRTIAASRPRLCKTHFLGEVIAGGRIVQRGHLGWLGEAVLRSGGHRAECAHQDCGAERRAKSRLPNVRQKFHRVVVHRRPDGSAASTNGVICRSDSPGQRNASPRVAQLLLSRRDPAEPFILNDSPARVPAHDGRSDCIDNVAG
jgi:hypothetical protein